MPNKCERKRNHQVGSLCSHWADALYSHEPNPHRIHRSDQFQETSCSAFKDSIPCMAMETGRAIHASSVWTSSSTSWSFSNASQAAANPAYAAT